MRRLYQHKEYAVFRIQWTEMSNCDFCHQTAVLYQHEPELDENLNHAACRAEAARRCNSGKCVKCNGDMADETDLTCTKCENNNLDYEGYDGPK